MSGANSEKFSHLLGADLASPCNEESAGGESIFDFVRSAVISNIKGLHARAAATFVKTAVKYSSDIIVERNGQEVCGKSIMGLMMLAAAKGCEIQIKTKGKDAEDAINALVDLVDAKFNEE